jgi:cytochrome P450
MLAAVRAFGALVAMFNFLHRDWFPPWKKFVHLRGKVHALLQSQVDERKASPGDDICSLLVAARDEDGQPMDDQEMVEQLFTMVLAGHETTAVSLAFAVDELWRRPELVDRLRQELEPTGGDPEKLASHKLLDAVCAESLRIRPLLPLVSRRLTRPFELCGYTIPPGMGVAAGVMLTHFREDLYPEPLKFRPERFMNGKSFSPHEYFPWGGGARRCLGAAFAMYEMKIVLGKLVLAGKIDLRSPTRARFAARAATVGPRGGVKVVYTPAS